MRRFLLLICVVLISLTALSQNNTLPPFDGNQIARMRVENIAREVNRTHKEDKMVIGNQYLSDDWMYGAISLKNSTALMGKLRYNIYLQQIELLTDNNDTLYLSDISKVDNIDIGNHSFIYRLYVGKEADKSYLKGGYFQKLAQTNTGQLLIQHSKSMELDSYVSNYMGGGGTNNYYYRHQYDLYFLPDKNTQLEKISKLDEVGEMLFSGDIAIFREYIKKYNIHLKDYRGLMQIVQLYKKMEKR